MSKKLSLLILVIAFVLSLTACAFTTSNGAQQNGTSEQTQNGNQTAGKPVGEYRPGFALVK